MPASKEALRVCRSARSSSCQLGSLLVADGVAEEASAAAAGDDDEVDAADRGDRRVLLLLLLVGDDGPWSMTALVRPGATGES